MFDEENWPLSELETDTTNVNVHIVSIYLLDVASVYLLFSKNRVIMIWCVVE